MEKLTSGNWNIQQADPLPRVEDHLILVARK